MEPLPSWRVLRTPYNHAPCVCVCVSDFLIPLQTSAKYLVPILMKRCPWRNRWPLSAATFTSVKYPPSDHTSRTGTDLLVSSLTFSGPDYCNFTLSGLPSSSLNRLQKVQNNAAKRPQTKIWLRYYPSGEKQNKNTAPCWGPYPLQNRHTCFQALWEFSSSTPFRTTWHLPTVSNSSVQQWKTYLNSARSRSFTFNQLKSGTLFLHLPATLHLSPL